jgi:hypothetical protein
MEGQDTTPKTALEHGMVELRDRGFFMGWVLESKLLLALRRLGARRSSRSKGELKSAPLAGASTTAEMEKLLAEALKFRSFKPDMFGFERQSRENDNHEERWYWRVRVLVYNPCSFGMLTSRAHHVCRCAACQRKCICPGETSLRSSTLSRIRKTRCRPPSCKSTGAAGLPR